jgi:hypothetical protein
MPWLNWVIPSGLALGPMVWGEVARARQRHDPNRYLYQEPTEWEQLMDNISGGVKTMMLLAERGINTVEPLLRTQGKGWKTWKELSVEVTPPALTQGGYQWLTTVLEQQEKVKLLLETQMTALFHYTETLTTP